MNSFHKTHQRRDNEEIQENGTMSASFRAPLFSPMTFTSRPRSRSLGASTLIGFILPLVLIILWQLAVVVGWIDQNLLPAPTTVLATLIGLIRDGTLGGDLLASSIRWVVGFLIGGTLGLLAGSFVGLSRLAERVLDTSVQMIRTVPFLALAPLLVLWLGLDEPPKITLIALASFFPLYLNTFAGIRNVDRKLIEIGRVYRLSQPKLLLRVILPAALPEILTGVRYGLSVAWLALVLAELLGAQLGGPSGKNDTFPLLVLQRAGIKDTEVEWFKLENDVGRSALLTGAIDAWRTWDPFYADVQAAKEAVPLVDGESYIQIYVTLFGRADYISSYPDAVKRFITTYKQALDYVKNHHTEAVSLFVQQNKLTSQVAELTLSRRQYVIQAPTQDYLDDLVQQSKLLKQFGVLKIEPDWSKAVNTTLAQQALGN